MKYVTSVPGFLVFFLVMTFLILPVAGSYETTTSVAPDATQAKPYVSATVSSASITAGQPITVSGTATGNVTPGIQIWIFAGNYVNVSIVPVNADGTFSKTYNTGGLPPATYYVFVQHPGADNNLEIMTQGFSGQVTNADTGSVIFNFTGVGSVHDDAAAIALTNALNAPGINDIYTKTQFIISGPGTTPPPTTPAVMPGSDRDSHGCIGSAGYAWCNAKQKCLRSWEEPCQQGSAVPSLAPSNPTITKSSVPALAAIAVLILAFCAVAIRRKK